MNLGQLFFGVIGRALLWLRYKVEVHGAENLKGLRGPAIVCPNHPGLLDPVLVMSHVGGVIPLRPLVTEAMYKKPGLYPFMLLINALSVPELETQSQSAKEKTRGIIDRIIEGLDQNGIFLIYPAGRLERKGYEILGGTRAVPEILQRRPNTKVVLVRTSGLWGSLSGFAQTGTDPNLDTQFIRVLKILVSNLIIFVPRRKIRIDIEIFDPKSVPSFNREDLNPYLENWYNSKLPKDPIFVPYHFYFGPRTFEFPKLADQFEVPLEKITQETKDSVNQLVGDRLKRPLTDRDKDPMVELDVLGLDSLDRMELTLQIEQQFGFRSDAVAVKLGDLWALAQGLAPKGDGNKPISVPPVWFAPRKSPEADLTYEGTTIPEAVIRKGLAHLGEAIAADDLSGVLTYERFLTGMRLMSGKFKDVPGDAVGVMLPASVAADLVVIGLMAAGKLPVLLNWTTGPNNLAHAVKTLKIQKIISSQKFIDRLGTSDLEKTGVEFVFLEEVRKSISKWQQLTGLLGIRYFGKSWLASLPKLSPGDPAVVLFTSGSEKAPKAVPLTHFNILKDASMGAKALGMKRSDILLGFLPPFHSFGLSGNMVLPLMTGMPVVHHADPTDAAGLARKIAAYKPSLVLTTPTFFSYILSAAKPGNLDSLRLVVVGAEKCPEIVFTRAEQATPKAVLVEGYGITECAPVVSVNRPGNSKRGSIGLPLEEVEVLVVDPDALTPLPRNKRGLLLITGPTIFPGYLHYDGPSPFHDHEGKRWYNTGDLAMVDDDGFIHFAGRLKRFLKVGGEMVSLPALEEPFAKLFPVDENGPKVAVEGIETPTGRKIVLFVTGDYALNQANDELSKAGFRGVMRLDEVRKIDKIPVLGTGKTDYKILRGMIT